MLNVVNGNDGSNSGQQVTPLLDEIVRDGAQQMLAAALRAKVAAYIALYTDQIDENGHRLVVGNGYHNERESMTAAGSVLHFSDERSFYSLNGRPRTTRSDHGLPDCQHGVPQRIRLREAPL